MAKMKAVTLFADWDPKPDFKLGPKDIEGKQTYLGSKVWRNPRIEIVEHDIPEPGPEEVLIEVKACGICGSDVHMAEPDKDGYILYPGLTGFPTILGHELSGVVVKAGERAFDKTTNKPFKGGELVCAEEMVWCGSCKPCADGYPNHCERLDEIGFNINGAFAKYIVLPAKLLWSLEPLRKRYKDEEIFLAGSLVEPTSVAYNAVIERGGGIRPGDNVVICGGGPIGLAACAILKRQGAANVILSEPQPERAELGLKMGADHVINPLEKDFAEEVLRLTDGMGANLYLEATGLPDKVYPGIEQAIWEGRTLNSTVVIVARADAKIPVTGEVLQVRRARIIGAQGHSGHGTFPRVIQAMASGMDMLPLITKKISLEEVPENIIELRTNRKDCKITCVMD
ncbi:scyllo-inosose 3-dehydrogenase [Koleobacter methoxysyntrophicus]|jgi:(R,R)-butanediol dehydrogenase/meso-butanediol dehydrogenase/diacetyl reductase|uniref:Scyllo-inosose 3-dehydrogenase n=2 Tax=Koleobacter methoxysyntrophicus TaxID=2751313 RepID=A0A8A0RJZ4_9FIRM|nr:scyllo-inosose 3-dehydrogenase [Koleobacter methoxysyntrophicus]QSQ08665.1 scyllo-inosose 3-dehydrogenase [Koleobacter methoxysyntrophicus]